MKTHDGSGISQSIIDELTKWGILSSQIEGGSLSGQYFHISVPDHFVEKLNLGGSFICTWDPLHKGGVVDSHIRGDVKTWGTPWGIPLGYPIGVGYGVPYSVL